METNLGLKVGSSNFQNILKNMQKELSISLDNRQLANEIKKIQEKGMEVFVTELSRKGVQKSIQEITKNNSKFLIDEIEFNKLIQENKICRELGLKKYADKRGKLTLSDVIGLLSLLLALITFIYQGFQQEQSNQLNEAKVQRQAEYYQCLLEIEHTQNQKLENIEKFTSDLYDQVEQFFERYSEEEQNSSK